jgi:hypothetical protein
LRRAKVDERVSPCSAGQTCYQVPLTMKISNSLLRGPGKEGESDKIARAPGLYIIGTCSFRPLVAPFVVGMTTTTPPYQQHPVRWFERILGFP